MQRKVSDYLHSCLDLHGEVTRLRYGKTQRLDEVERVVQDTLANGGGLWEVIRAIHDHDAFGADMFGFLPEQIERELKECAWCREWRPPPKQELVAELFHVFRQIEPTSMVLRFLDAEHYGIMSSPVAVILGVRPKRKPPVTYSSYLKSLRKIGEERGFKRIADVEMALWALQVGVLDGVLPPEQAGPLEQHYQDDIALRQLATRNLTVQLFSENKKLDLAEALLGTDVEVAGQLAGIEFEQMVGKHMGVAKRRSRARESLEALITRCRDERVRQDWDRARLIRNHAIHEPKCLKPEHVEFLIDTARKVPI